MGRIIIEGPEDRAPATVKDPERSPLPEKPAAEWPENPGAPESLAETETPVKPVTPEDFAGPEAPGTPEKTTVRLPEAVRADAWSRIRRHLAAEQEAARGESERNVRELIRQNRETLGASERFHDEMCRRANEVQYAWTDALRESIEQLNAVREELYGFFGDWKRSLYPAEFEPIARNYVDLYRFVRVERRLTDDVMFQGLERTFFDGADLPEALLTRFHKLDRTMNGFLQRFELSLQSLGMYVYFPEAGSLYEEGWHQIERSDAAADRSGYGTPVIEQCVLPGVAMRYNEGADAVILPAVVRLQAPSGGWTEYR